MKLLDNLLKKFIQRGTLKLYGADGALRVFGGVADGPVVTARMHTKELERKLFFNPELYAAEAYMDGTLTFENGSRVYDFLHLFSVNRRSLGAHPVQQALRRYWGVMKRWQQRNPIGRAARNVQHHYDIPTPFYRMWLDETMAYSCAYFATPETPLAEAQRAKYRHIAAKLKLEPGMHVLDIGSGWGGLAIHLAKECGVRVTGLNISTDQLAASCENAAVAGVADRVEFIDQDYRLYQGKFDRVTSVGMMEHVGIDGFDNYFKSVKRFLKPGGFAMIHAIGRMAPPPGSTPPFIRKYIFPGSYAPSMSEVFASLERTGMWCGDFESLRLHYYWTLKAWRERYEARREEAVAMMGERFCRMWDFYLAAAEFFFLHGSNFVYQLLIAETRDAVPVIRDYIVDEERKLAAQKS